MGKAYTGGFGFPGNDRWRISREGGKCGSVINITALRFPKLPACSGIKRARVCHKWRERTEIQCVPVIDRLGLLEYVGKGHAIIQGMMKPEVQLEIIMVR